jgi:microcystin-dependent protein
MADPFLGEVRIMSFNFAPKGWTLCNGQILPINQNAALFALLGTFYGGNGTTTFQLPNLQGCVPIHSGTDPFGNPYVQGQIGGEQNHTVITTEMPAHTHQAHCYSGPALTQNPANNSWARDATSITSPYGNATPTTEMNPGNTTTSGGSQPHNNMQPYLVLNYCIALAGIFPSRN